MTTKPDLPDGFDDAPRDVQLALLETYQGRDLVAGICDALDVETPRGSQLRKSHKARVYLALRERVSAPEAAVGDGGVQAYPPQHTTVGEAVAGDPAVDDDAASDREDGPDEDLVDACPECDGTTVYARETKPEPERWRCSTCEATFDEPNRRPRKQSGKTDDELACSACDFVGDTRAELTNHQYNEGHYSSPRPAWLARDPNDIVYDAPVSRTLPEVIEAVVSEDDVLGVYNRLGMNNVNTCREHVLQPLGLISSTGGLITDDLLDERLSVISEWVDE